MLLAIPLFICSFFWAHGAAEDDSAKTLQDIRNDMTKMMEHVAKLEEEQVDMTKMKKTFEEHVAKLEEEHVEDMNRMKASLEERVAMLEDLAKIGIMRSCAEYEKYGLKTSGLYMVDPDGSPIGQKPFQVYCNFTTGATEIMHDTENVTDVVHCHDPGCYQKNITYIDGSTAEPVSMYQIISLIELASHCEQEINYDCFLAPLTAHNIDYAFWEDRHGGHNTYFTGSNYGYHVCDCHYEADGCLEEATEHNTCNCDANLPVPVSDSGTITNSTALPIMKMFFGGLNYEMVSGAFQLGRLKCYGEKDVTIGTSCSSLKKQGVITSGYYNILQEGSLSTSIVYCDMESGTYSDVPQVDQLSGASPLGTILSWVPKPENGLADETIPDGWLPCDGTTIPKGPWAGGRTPDLNTVGAFLRGGQGNNILEMEDDQVEDHQHEDSGHSHSCSATSSQSSHSHSYNDFFFDYHSTSYHTASGTYLGLYDYSRTTDSVAPSVTTSCSTSSHTSGIGGMSSGSRHGTETRPRNMKVHYVIRCW